MDKAQRIGSWWRGVPRVVPLALAIAALVALGLLAGCAAPPSGVKMSDAEAAACRAQGCTVWTEVELKQLALEAMRQGYILGARRQQRGGGL